MTLIILLRLGASRDFVASPQNGIAYKQFHSDATFQAIEKCLEIEYLGISLVELIGIAWI